MKKNQRDAKNRNRRLVKCPVTVGNFYELDITETTPMGVGIGRIKGFIILVDDTKVGDHLKVIITKTESMDAEAKIAE